MKPGSPQTVFFDTFRLTPLGKDDIAPLPPSEEPLTLDNCESAEKPRATWKCSGAAIQSSTAHATERKHSLKVTFSSPRNC